MAKKDIEESKKEATQKEELKRKATIKLENESKNFDKEEVKSTH